MRISGLEAGAEQDRGIAFYVILNIKRFGLNRFAVAGSASVLV
jgi:hypothetical protein